MFGIYYNMKKSNINMFRKLNPFKYARRCYAKEVKAADTMDPGVKLSFLHNGMRIATEWKSSPLACMALYVDMGSRYDLECNHGITHFIEHLAYNDYKGLKQSRLEDDLTFLPANLSVETSRDLQSFTAIFPPAGAPKIIDILCKTIVGMDITDKSVEKAKYKIGQEMIDIDNNPRAVVFDYLHQAAFQGTPLARRVIGPSKNVRDFTRDMAINHIVQQYQPYKICLVTSGRIDHDQMVRYAEAILGKMCPHPAFTNVYGPSRYCGSQIVYRDDSMPYAHVAIAFEAPGYTSPDYFPLYLATSMIGQWHKSQGGWEGNALPLARASSVSSLCESYEAFYIAYADVGLWGVYFVGDRLKLDDMRENIQYQLMNMCTTMLDSDLDRGKNAAVLQSAREVEGTVRSAHDIGRQIIFTCTRKSLKDKIDNLCRIKLYEMRETCYRYFYDRDPVVIAVGPTECLPDYSRIQVGQYWLRV